MSDVHNNNFLTENCLLQRQFIKTIAQRIYLSTITKSITSCSVLPRYYCLPFLFERNVNTNRQDCVQALKKQEFDPCTRNFNQLEQEVNTSAHIRTPGDANMEKKKWNRTLTIKQSSKNNENKILTFNISVLDTYPDDVEQERSTVVAVHGFPGSGNDFDQLAVKLYEKGIRLVAPTSLGMVESPITLDVLGDVDFSTDGRARNLQLILKEMNISRIDMIVGHSAGAWTIYKAGATWENVGSILGINPGGAKPNSVLRPYWFSKLIAAAMYWSLGRMIIMPFITQVYRLIGFRDVVSHGYGINLIASQQYITTQGFPDVPVNAESVRKRQLPVIFAYALNDKIVEPSIFFDMAHNVMRIPAQNTVTYTADKTPSRDPFFVPEGWLTRCLVFARGGHVVHLAHAQELAEQIEDVLKYASTVKADTLLEERCSVSSKLVN